MIFFLISVFLIQLGIIFYLGNKIFSERSAFDSRLKPLEEFIVALSKEQDKQLLQLQLSDDLKIKMKEVNAALNKNIFEISYQLLGDVYPKKEP